jgi:hypothetical protein
MTKEMIKYANIATKEHLNGKLVKIVWNPDDDTYKVYLYAQPFFEVPIAYLEELQKEIARVMKEVSA